MKLDKPLRYIETGLSVVPVQMPEKKTLGTWKEYQQRIITVSELEEKLGNLNGTAGIAIVCGKVSGNLEVLDFDNKFGVAESVFTTWIGIPEVNAIIKKYNLPYEKTLNKGYHLFYRCSKLEGNKKLAVMSNDEKTETIIETRGEGGYVVVAPTQGYNVLHGNLENIARISIDDRETLLSHARAFGEIKETKWRNVEFNRQNSFIGPEIINRVLSDNGWRFAYERGENSYFIRPGKMKGVSASYNGNVFYPFSTNCSPFEAEKGYNNFQVYTLLKHDGNIQKAKKELIDLGILPENDSPEDPSAEHFIYLRTTGAGTDQAQADHDLFIKFLTNHGFRRYDLVNEFRIVRVDNKICEDMALHQIAAFCAEGLSDARLSFLVKNSSKFINLEKLQYLPALDEKFNQDTKEFSYFYFEDAFIRVDNNGNMQSFNYSNLDGLIWKNQIVQRPAPDITKKDGPAGDFRMFLMKVTTAEKTPERFASLVSAIGYMLDRYKNSAVTKAVIFCDEGEIASLDPDSSQGGTGKSLICKAISQMRNTAYYNGKTFNFNSNFAWQKINDDTEIIWIDDTTKWFKFENLFPMITGDFEIEKKNQNAYTIPFNRAPKFVIPTNYTIPSQDVSTKRRLFEVELAPVYNEKHTPVDDFGKRFFDDWDRDEWERFDLFMISTVRFFRKNGLKEYEKINLDLRKLLQAVPQEFLEFFEAYIETNKRFANSDLFADFIKEAPGKNGAVKPKSVTRWVKAYLNFYKIDFIDTKIGSKWGIQINKLTDLPIRSIPDISQIGKDEMLF